MTDHKARPEPWQEDAARWLDAILELRARVEALEGKYETMRLATLEWGEDVDKVKRWSDQHLQRIEKLEGTRRPASKVYEISEPLQLTPEQAQHVAALLAPNSKPTSNDRQIRSSLVERVLVSDWIASRGCAKSSAHKWLGNVGIRPRSEVNRATGKVESWLTNSEASILTAYVDALDLGCKSAEARIKAWDSINARLLNRVNDACLKVDEFDDALEWSRAAIREVAAWLREQHDGDLVAATVLEREAER